VLARFLETDDQSGVLGHVVGAVAEEAHRLSDDSAIAVHQCRT
jgi:hypothetical protein